MTYDRHEIVEQAVDWHLRMPVMSADDWILFTAWLEADPAHARAFDRIELAARTMPDSVANPQPIAANDSAPTSIRRPWFAALVGAAVAASVAALVAPAVMQSRASIIEIATVPGETRSIALADGTRIELNGASRLHYGSGNVRLVSLDSGEATFHVVHDSRNPFTVRSGNRIIEDVGTVFNVLREGSRLDVQVAEGAVLFQPGFEAVTLQSGHAISARDGERGGLVSDIPVDTVGGWSGGRLRFTAEPVSRLAEAIHRRYGIYIVLAPAMAKQKFTGIITLSGNADQDVPHVAALIGARWRQDGARWTLSPEPREPI